MADPFDQSAQPDPQAGANPDFWNNLMNFGLATMAGSNKPFSTVGSALGEGGQAAVTSARANQAQRSLSAQQNAEAQNFQGQAAFNKAQAGLINARINMMNQPETNWATWTPGQPNASTTQAPQGATGGGGNPTGAGGTTQGFNAPNMPKQQPQQGQPVQDDQQFALEYQRIEGAARQAQQRAMGMGATDPSAAYKQIMDAHYNPGAGIMTSLSGTPFVVPGGVRDPRAQGNIKRQETIGANNYGTDAQGNMTIPGTNQLVNSPQGTETLARSTAAGTAAGTLQGQDANLGALGRTTQTKALNDFQSIRPGSIGGIGDFSNGWVGNFTNELPSGAEVQNVVRGSGGTPNNTMPGPGGKTYTVPTGVPGQQNNQSNGQPGGQTNQLYSGVQKNSPEWDKAKEEANVANEEAAKALASQKEARDLMNSGTWAAGPYAPVKEFSREARLFLSQSLGFSDNEISQGLSQQQVFDKLAILATNANSRAVTSRPSQNLVEYESKAAISSNKPQWANEALLSMNMGNADYSQAVSAYINKNDPATNNGNGLPVDKVKDNFYRNVNPLIFTIHRMPVDMQQDYMTHIRQSDPQAYKSIQQQYQWLNQNLGPDFWDTRN